MTAPRSFPDPDQPTVPHGPRRHSHTAGGHRRRALPDHVAQLAVWFTRYSMGAFDILHGGGYLLGAPASAPSLVLMSGVMPMPVWGGLFVLAGLLICAGQVPFGAPIAAAVWLCWAVFNIITLGAGTATGWGWPLASFAAAMHLGQFFFIIHARRVDTARKGDTWTAR